MRLFQRLSILSLGLLATLGFAESAAARTWARAKELSQTQNTVIIDISEQQAHVLRNGQSIWNSGTVTGKTETPTDLGEFRMTYKTTNARLQGSDYDVRVKYWMPYNRGEGLHDAWWRADSEFGAKGRNWVEGSHGCTNLPEAKAERLYQLVRAGTPVVVVP